MKLIIDVGYQNNKAKVVGGFFEDWNVNQLLKLAYKEVDEVQEYIPGEFYKRELPCILEFLKEHNLEEIECIIIDGFIFLDNENKKGLGAYLYESLNNKLPIIGVAKSKFYNNTKNTIELVRGQSKNAIYISAIGIELDEAAKLINSMHGEFRLPNLIKQVDTETRK
mgnify:FL=1